MVNFYKDREISRVYHSEFMLKGCLFSVVKGESEKGHAKKGYVEISDG